MADESDDQDDDQWDPAGRANSKPDASVTPDLFKKWRAPRYGNANPERMNNPVWEWLVRCRVSAYWANKEFEGPSSRDAGPCWCFRRFGQSKTQLPDGRVVLIGGEHEDFYDPDFFIYNDVVLKNPDGSLDVYGYPRAIFKPTDGHSATLVGERIVLIGSLGYPEERIPGFTQVYVLDLSTFAISAKNCTGTAPGWLHKHKAEYSPADNSILITGGLLDTGDKDRPETENIDDWKLRLSDWRWERLTKRQWKSWDLRREDGRTNELFAIGSVHFWSRKKHKEKFDEEMSELADKLGFEPDLDLFSKLYNSPVPHEKIPDKDDEYRVFRINVNGVTVRYNEDFSSVRVTIEGDLPTSTAETIVSDLLNKLSTLERKPYELVRL